MQIASKDQETLMVNADILIETKRLRFRPWADSDPEAKPKDLLSPYKMPVIRAPRPDRIGRTLFLPFHLL